VRLRVAVAGFQHETNTFVATPTRLRDFEIGGGWPPLVRGAEMVERLAATAPPIGGALTAARAADVELVPVLWCMAQPSGRVTDDAFETIAGEIVDGSARAHDARPLDGVYLDLHGAMVTSTFEDGEGELLRRLREVLPASVPVVASLDFHANVTAAMVAHTQVLELYRTYPHVDMRDTGARALRRLVALAAGKVPTPGKALRRPPFLVALTWQCTLAEPAASLVGAHVAADGGARPPWVSAAMGFPLADIADAGPALLTYGPTQKQADRLADDLLARWLEAEPALDGAVLDAATVVEEAERLAAGPGEGPVVVADTQDNPGGGGPGDTTGLLRALIDARAEGALVVHIADAEVARAAHAAGVGARLPVRLGGKVLPEYGEPVAGEALVLALGDGRFVGTGPMSRGNPVDLGPVARLGLDGVEVVVATRKAQASEPELLRHLGVEPAAVPILALKSSVHFRAAYQEMARAVLVAAAPGPVTADLRGLRFERLRPGVRIAGARRSAPCP
jgi:microcystin degradation protein MlrC